MKLTAPTQLVIIAASAGLCAGQVFAQSANQLYIRLQSTIATLPSESYEITKTNPVIIASISSRSVVVLRNEVIDQRGKVLLGAGSRLFFISERNDLACVITDNRQIEKCLFDFEKDGKFDRYIRKNVGVFLIDPQLGGGEVIRGGGYDRNAGALEVGNIYASLMDQGRESASVCVSISLTGPTSGKCYDPISVRNGVIVNTSRMYGISVRVVCNNGRVFVEVPDRIINRTIRIMFDG